MKLKTIAISALSLLPVISAGNAGATPPGNTFYGGLGLVNFDSNTAEAEGVEDQATYIRLGWEMHRSSWIFGAGISGFIYKDNEEFTQRVEDYFGDESTEESSANAFSLYAEGGYSYDLSSGFTLDLLGGYDLQLASERSIDNCENCYSEDIEIDTGLYISPRLAFYAQNGFTLNLAYIQYLGSDVEQAFMLGAGYSF